MSVCVLDTDVVIAALDRADAHHGEAARAFKHFAADDYELLLCTVNYAEALVRPAQDQRSFRGAIDAIAGLGIRLLAPDAKVAREAARFRGHGVSLADGFALATAAARDAGVASFDKRVRRVLGPAGLQLSPPLT